MMSAQRSAYGRMASALLSDRPSWQRDGRDWPNREASRFVRVDHYYWHVQKLGQGPVLLLVHGTGAATHSWRDLLPMLAQHFTVVAVDLPGHGFSDMPSHRSLSLPGMARALGDLMQTLELEPAVAVGHSAGVAILVRMCLDGRIAPDGLISLNGALMPLRGVPGQVFSPVAKLLVSCPMVPQLVAWRASGENVVERLLNDTGSILDAGGLDFYRRLMQSPGHVAACPWHDG